MSNVLQLIAAIHRETATKNNTIRNYAKKKLARRQAYFHDTGLPAMWADVENIKIPNPVPDAIDGLTVPLSALLVATAEENQTQTGFVFYGKNDTRHEWVIDDNGIRDEDVGPQFMIYRVTSNKTCFGLSHSHPDAKKKFVDAFVKWLAKHITPHVLLDMDINFTTVIEVAQPSRRIVAKAEA